MTGRRTTLSVLALGVVLIAAAGLYRPWRPVPLPISDWGELLQVLRPTTGVSHSYRALVETFHVHGRHQPIQMAAVAAHWTMFRTGTAAWRVARFVVMALVIVGSYLLARSLGAAPLPAVIAASLFVVASMAHQLWYILQIAEPTGLLFLVGAGLAAARYRTTTRPVAWASAIIVLAAASVLSKETYLAAVPFIFLIAARPTRHEHVMAVVRHRRVLALAVGLGVVLAITSIVPLLQIRAVAAGGAYARQYGQSFAGGASLSNVFAAMLLPVTRVWFFPANVAFVAVMVWGGILAVRDRGREAAWLIAAGMSAPLLGAVLYAAWPAVEGYYGAAYLPGLMLVFALALTALLARDGLPLRIVSIAAIASIVWYGALFARESALAYEASRRVDEATAAHVGALRGLDSVLVAVPLLAPTGGFATAMDEYMRGMGLGRLPPGRDVPCDESRPPERGRVALVIFSQLCPLDASTRYAWSVSQTYSTLEWKRFRPVERRSEAAVWVSP